MVPFDFWRSQNNWCQLMRNGGNSRSKSHCFYNVTGLTWVSMRCAGGVKLALVVFVKCLVFLVFTVHLLFLSFIVSFSVRHFAAFSKGWPHFAKSPFKGILTWQWLMMTEGCNTVLRGHRWASWGRFQMTIVLVWLFPSLSPHQLTPHCVL